MWRRFKIMPLLGCVITRLVGGESSTMLHYKPLLKVSIITLKSSVVVSSSFAATQRLKIGASALE